MRLLFGSLIFYSYICPIINQLIINIMDREQNAKDFAKWLIRNTIDVATVGPCRRYKNKIYNVDELYDIWQEFKKETKTKY